MRQYNHSLELLARGDFENGWRDYEARPRSARGFTQPLWLGEGLVHGKKLLLHGEQGLGDTLQFCRYAPLAAARGAVVLLEVQPQLIAVLKGLLGVTQLIAAGSLLPQFDYQCPLMSLPLAFKTTLDTIPAAPYLYSDPLRVQRWRDVLGVRGKPRVGLVWSGSASRTIHNRSIPLAECMTHLPRGFEYFSLQREVRDADRATSRIATFNETLLDFAGTAALCECMDVVVSIDTSLAHLSAALGRPTWVLLPADAEWRWLRDRSDSPWYPTATLYRQSDRNTWRNVFARVAADLKRTFLRPA